MQEEIQSGENQGEINQDSKLGLRNSIDDFFSGKSTEEHERGYHEPIDTRTVDTHMRRLREKLGRFFVLTAEQCAVFAVAGLLSIARQSG